MTKPRRGMLPFVLAAALMYGCSGDAPTDIVEQAPPEPPPDDSPAIWTVEYPAVPETPFVSMNALWGSSPDHMLAVGCWNPGGSLKGIVIRDAGSGWSIAYESAWCTRGVWGSGPTAVFVVGSSDGGHIARFDGSTWREMSLPAEADHGLNAVWGSAPTDVFAVGSDGNIVRFDGTNWNKMFSGTLVSLNAVWGSSSSNVWAVGDEGVIRHFDGAEWKSVASPTTANLTGVWGASPTSVFAVGYTRPGFEANAVLLRFDGQSWSVVSASLPAGTTRTGNITGTSASDVYFGTGNGPVYHYDGRGAPSELSSVPGLGPLCTRGPPWATCRTNGIDSPRIFFYGGPWGDSKTGVHLLGDEATILKLEAGRWHVSHGLFNGLDVWAASGTVAFRVGEYGTILKYNGRGWRMMPTPTHATLRSVWGSSATNVYAVASYVLLHFDGTGWRDITAQLPVVPSQYNFLLGTVRGRSADEVYLTANIRTGAGYRAALLRFDGGAWALDPDFPDDLDLRDFRNYPTMWVGSSEGLVIGVHVESAAHLENGVWQTKLAPKWIGRPWGARPDYVLGTAGVQYDGQAWTTWQYSTSNDGVGGIWGTSIDDIVVSAGNGGIYERTGTGGGWDLATRVSVGGYRPGLGAVHGSGSDRFIVGGLNVIVHGRR